MQWVIDFLPESQVVRVTTEGSMTLQENMEFIDEALALSRVHGANRFLVDHRRMVPALKIEELFDLPVTNARTGVGPNLRVAVVYSLDSPGREDFFFYDARNRSKGIRSICLFTDLEHAMEWLRESD